MSEMAPERQWSGPLCSCTSTQLMCEEARWSRSVKCCDGCEHTALPPDVRPQAHVAVGKA